MFLQIILTILTISFGVEAYKILIISPFPSYSHQRPVIPLTERLVRDGHQLFVVSPDAVPGLEQNANYTFMNASFLYEFMSAGKKEGTINLQRQVTQWDVPAILFKPIGIIATHLFLSEPFLEFKRRVESDRIHFDVVIISVQFLPFACPITRILSGNTPIIVLSTNNMGFFAEDDLGSIINLSYVPSPFSAFTDKMSLFQRIENWVAYHYIMSSFKTTVSSIAKRFIQENYGQGNGTLVDTCYFDTSLSLVTSNFLYFYPRPLAPNVIEVGPLHLKSRSLLPGNLQDWMDGAEKGVIYLSLGSNMKSKSLPENVRANLLKFFSQLQPGYRVLWKWELDGKIPGQSNNILAQKWLPQESVLAHPKLRVFITQGGLQSFQEAVHFGVPVVGIPWFFDQENNVAKMEDAGLGVRLLPSDLNSYEKIKSAVDAVLYDEKYLQNMKKHSAISHDFTAQGMDKAVFWVEHVAKFGGAHLRPSTADTTLFQYFCLDIISVLIVICLATLYVIHVVFKFLLFILLQSPSAKIKKA